MACRPDDRDRQASHETIYTAKYARHTGELIACLQQALSNWQRRSRCEDQRGHPVDAVSITCGSRKPMTGCCRATGKAIT